MNYNSIRNEAFSFRERFSAFVESLPDAQDDVQFIGRNIGIVNLSTIMEAPGKCLCAGYYLNNTVKSELLRIIQTIRLENFSEVIGEIIETGRIAPQRGLRSMIKINTTFIRKLREMWEREVA